MASMATLVINRNTPSFERKPITWFLVADGASAQAYVRQRNKALIPMAGNAKHRHYMEKAEQHMIPVVGASWRPESIGDFETSKKLGRSFESVSPTRHAFEPSMNIHEELKMRFMHHIAERLHDLYLKNAFHYIVLIAPSPLLSELRKKLHPQVSKTVLAELSKDYTHFKGRDLATRLENIFDVRI